MNNLNAPQGSNNGGLLRLWFIPVEEVLAVPDAVDGVVVDDITLDTDKAFAIAYFTPGSLGFSEPMKVSPQGDYFEQKIEGFCAQDAPDKDVQLRLMFRRRFICIYMDMQGQYRLIGSLTEPLSFTYSFGTDNKFGGRKGYSFTWFCDAVEGSVYYTGSFVTNAGSISPGIIGGAVPVVVSPHTLGSHSDVSFGTLANGDLIQWNGSDWVNVNGVFLPSTYLDIDGTLAANSDSKIASQKATKTYADTKVPLSYIDTNTSLTANSDSKIASQKATKAYADAQLVAAKAYADTLVVGLLDDRGNWDASSGNYPTAGSGVAGAVMKGDLWTISVDGDLGVVGNSVTVGDVIRAGIDSPGQTVSNWVHTQNNLTYTAENSSNKATDFTTSNNTKYPSVLAVNNRFIDWINSMTGKTTPVDADAIAINDSAASNVGKKVTLTNFKAYLKTYFDTLYESLTNKDASGGYAGLTLFKINFKNVANTFTSFFTNSNTAARTYTFPDKDGTVAMTNDAVMSDGRNIKLFSQSTTVYTQVVNGNAQTAVSIYIPGGTMVAGDRGKFKGRWASGGTQNKNLKFYLNTVNSTAGSPAQPGSFTHGTVATNFSGCEIVVKTSSSIDFVTASGAGLTTPVAGVVITNKAWNAASDLYLLVVMTNNTAPNTDVWTLDDYEFWIEKA